MTTIIPLQDKQASGTIIFLSLESSKLLSHWTELLQSVARTYLEKQKYSQEYIRQHLEETKRNVLDKWT